MAKAAAQPGAPAPLYRLAILTRWLRRILMRIIVVLFIIAITVNVVLAWTSRSMADLEPWHESIPDAEFTARDEGQRDDFSFEDYLKLEDRVFAEVEGVRFNRSRLGGRSELCRYLRDGPVDPERTSPNWNRSIEVMPAGELRGGVLLLHGLTDSPYSLRSVAEALHQRGFYVLLPRIPGHGTVPAGLRRCKWEDWLALTAIAARHVRDRIGPDRPMYVCGYSNGGSLAMLYTLDCLKAGGSAPAPNRVFLFSPAIGITAWARASNMHRLVSWIPGFRKYRWLSIEPEYDPYKYTSFPKNAGAQSWQITNALRRALDQAAADGSIRRMPPIITFQSLVDDTVVARATLDRLYLRLLPESGSELVVFDVNNESQMDSFLRQDFRPLIEAAEADTTLPFALTVITNETPDSLALVARSKPALSDSVTVEPLGVDWPPEVYSLSHVAVPFPPDDPMYGATPIANPAAADGFPPPPPSPLDLTLGSMSLRGERRVLRLSASALMRMRYNPAFAYMIQRIEAAVAEQSSTKRGQQASSDR